MKEKEGDEQAAMIKNNNQIKSTVILYILLDALTLFCVGDNIHIRFVVEFLQPFACIMPVQKDLHEHFLS